MVAATTGLGLLKILTFTQTRRKHLFNFQGKMSATRKLDASKPKQLYIEQLTTLSEGSDVGQTTSDKDAEKRLLRKLDMRIVPILWLMFMLAFLDRTNVRCAVPRLDGVTI
jgi:hypothetical protein